jgi:two-component system response regulator CpxR
METIKILLVDDEVDFVQALAQRLANHDMPAEVAMGGEAAMRLVINEVPDVVVLDLKMPGIGGIEILRYLKQIDPQIQVIFLTGHGSDAVRYEAMFLGAYDYLEKPVQIETLIQSIHAAYRVRRLEASRARLR